jgi:hypothetical protein
MRQDSSSVRPPWLVPGVISVVLVIGFAALPQGRALVGRFLNSLRMQKVQAVNVDLSAFTDPNANPSLHQMVAQMISDKVTRSVNESDQTASDAATAGNLAGFHVQLLSARNDPPKLVVAGEQAVNLLVDRARLQTIFTEAGHPELAVPASLDGAAVSVDIPRAVEVQYGTCPGPTNATNEIASNITGPTPGTTQYSDCVRLREGPSPIVKVPPELDVKHLAEIGLEVAGMTPSQATDFLKTVNWQSTLVMSVPRFLRSYEPVTVAGAQGTLLTMASRRGPGYTLIWSKNGTGYSMEGFGDSSQAVQLAESLK